MTQQQETLSAFMDGESGEDSIVDSVLADEHLTAKWQRYHVIRSGLRKETASTLHIDITKQVALALIDEPEIVAPKPKVVKQQFWGRVVPFAKHSSQIAVAASVALAVIIGVQQFNQPTPAEPLPAFRTGVTHGGLAPVSLQQTRPVARDDMSLMLEKKRKINAIIADHEQQVRLKQITAQESAVKRTEGDEKLEQPDK